MNTINDEAIELARNHHVDSVEYVCDHLTDLFPDTPERIVRDAAFKACNQVDRETVKALQEGGAK